MRSNVLYSFVTVIGFHSSYANLTNHIPKLSQSTTKSKVYGLNDRTEYDNPYYVPLCYREGRDCCESFEEKCLDHNQCKETEICCLANCTVQCYNVSQLGKTPQNIFDEISANEYIDSLDSDPDFIRYMTKANPEIPVNRTNCYPKIDICCSIYTKECHDSSECKDNEICCEEDCGTACYLKSKLGQRMEDDDDLDNFDAETPNFND